MDCEKLANFGKDFTAEFVLSGFAIAVNPFGGADDRNPQTVEYGLQIGALRIHPTARLANSLDGLYDLLAIRTVLEFDPEVLTRSRFDLRIVPNVTLSLQDVRDALA
jgi:hypothetical protein